MDSYYLYKQSFIYFQGDRCEHEIDECESYQPCENGLCIGKQKIFLQIKRITNFKKLPSTINLTFKKAKPLKLKIFGMKLLKLKKLKVGF